MTQGHLYIHGQWSAGHGPVLTSSDPSHGTDLWQGASADARDVDRAVDAATEAFSRWSQTAFAARAQILERYAEQIQSHAEDLATMISQETGKPLWEAKTEIHAMTNKISISLKAYQQRCPDVAVPLKEGQRATRFHPHGVLAVLGPYNLPAHLPNGHIVPALLAGNTLVFKPSECTPLVGEWMARLWEAADLPPGVFNLVQGGRDTGQALAVHEKIQGVLFTGSAAVGQTLHRLCAGQTQKILALEMGGNNPLIVYRVKDLYAAAVLTIQSAFITSGQRCVCARRLIVPYGKDGDMFLDHLLALTKALRVGAYTDSPEPFMGPVISQRAAQQLLESQKLLRRHGGAILKEMTGHASHTALLEPGIIDVTSLSDLPDQEIFGPLLQVIRVGDFKEAVTVANQTKFGLSAGLLCDERASYDYFYQQIRAGIVNWNRPLTGASSEAPFGGIGQSGNHRPSAYFAADYCAYPVASMEQERVVCPEVLPPGLS